MRSGNPDHRGFRLQIKCRFRAVDRPCSLKRLGCFFFVYQFLAAYDCCVTHCDVLWWLERCDEGALLMFQMASYRCQVGRCQEGNYVLLCKRKLAVKEV